MSLPLKYGSRDPQHSPPAVKSLQGRLRQLGYRIPSLDGIFGKQTEAAVREFQNKNGLPVDGIVGPVTWAALSHAPAPEEPTPTPVPVPTPVPTPTPTPAPAPAPTNKPFGARKFGGFVAIGNKNTFWQLEPLTTMEAKLGKKFDLVSGFCEGGDLSDFTANMVKVANEGRDVLVSYDLPWAAADILTGKYDAKLKNDIAQTKKVSKPVYLRLWAEMNGNWATWSVAGSASKVSSTGLWIDAWRYIVKLFRDNGANAKFVWCPNNGDVGKIKLEAYYPGSAWVDVLGFDGYCWSDEWETHKQVYQPIYDRLIKLDAKLPIWIGETGCAEVGTKKAAWVQAMLAETGFPRIEAIAWFSEDKEEKWHLDSSPAVLEAFKQGLV